MEYEKIKQIVQDMSESKLSEINIEFADGTKISMKKDYTQPNENVIYQVNNEVAVKEDTSNLHSNDEKIITSPMVGTFYSKPSPSEDDYVSVGKIVSKTDTVCIIEAMKLLNEIEAGFDGKIVEIYCENGQPVEFGTKLFRIE